jgi:hypothetical protein
MPNEDPYDRYLEKRAEELGLPTDPEAYQDGGLAVAASALHISEADTIAALLNANGVPAWVEAPLAGGFYAGYAPSEVRILVPNGRLADAQRLIAEHPHQESPPEEGEETPEAALAPQPAVVLPAEPAAPTPRRSTARVAASLIILGFGILIALQTVSITLSDKSPWGSAKIWGLCVMGALAAGACVIGIRGLKRPPESKP